MYPAHKDVKKREHFAEVAKAMLCGDRGLV